jgi:hypothetical protein
MLVPKILGGKGKKQSSFVCPFFSYTEKKSFSNFPSPAGMSLDKLSLAGKNISIPGAGEFGQ